MSAIVSIRISPCDLCVTYLFCVLLIEMVLRWLAFDIGETNHLGKGLEPHSTSSHKSQNPRVVRAMMIVLDVPSVR